MNEPAHAVGSDNGRNSAEMSSRDSRETGYRWLLHSKRHPYYIVTPKYERISAGIKALHILCNALNRAGERAYIITRPYSSPDRAINAELLTPLLTRGIIQHDYEAGLTPIMIYPEVMSGNPYGAPCVVRYVLNYPGLLGGDATYSEDEFCVTYTKELASAVPNTHMTLFIPASDPHLFKPEPRMSRSGSCFYAGKYQEVHRGELFDVTRDSIEIHRQPLLSQTPEEISELFRRSEVFYTYENTALVIEALLCECPVVFLPNPYLTNAIAVHELGWDGIAWDTDEVEIDRAKVTVKQGRENYLRLFDEFARVLPVFIEQTQLVARERKYDSPICVRFPVLPGLLQLLIEKLEIFRCVRSERGILEALSMTLKRLTRL